MLSQNVPGLLTLDRPSPIPMDQLKRVALYDLNGTLASDLKGPGMARYGEMLKHQLAWVEALSDETVKKVFEKNEAELKGGLLGKKVADSVWELAKEPPRGTKAREVYYDLLELWVRRGEAGVTVFPEVWKPDGAIARDKKMGLEVITLSRGLLRLLNVVMATSKLDRVIDKTYSAIPYGGEKTAQCYYLFLLDLLKERKWVVRAYEDEPGNLEGLLAAGIALSHALELSDVPFEVVWVDRKRERDTYEGQTWLAGFEKEYASMQSAYRLNKPFKEIFTITDSLD